MNKYKIVWTYFKNLFPFTLGLRARRHSRREWRHLTRHSAWKLAVILIIACVLLLKGCYCQETLWSPAQNSRMWLCAFITLEARFHLASALSITTVILSSGNLKRLKYFIRFLFRSRGNWPFLWLAGKLILAKEYWFHGEHQETFN